MNKKDLSLVVVLILMIPLWLLFDSKVLKPLFPDPPAPAPTEEGTPAAPVVAAETLTETRPQ